MMVHLPFNLRMYLRAMQISSGMAILFSRYMYHCVCSHASHTPLATGVRVINIFRCAIIVIIIACFGLSNQQSGFVPCDRSLNPHNAL